MEGLPSLVRVWLSKLFRGELVIFPACMSHMAVSDGPEYSLAHSSSLLNHADLTGHIYEAFPSLIPKAESS